MPELPEVETTLRGIKPYITDKKVTNVIIRHPHLRWPIPPHLTTLLKGQCLQGLTRRGKYLLFEFATGTLILHLGMSGRLCVLSQPVVAKKHDHVDICFGKHYLRFTDPRRFGAVLWTDEPPETHPLLAKLGPEPLSEEFDGEYLWQRAQKKKVCVKSFVMDSHVVVGVGNIYATESLFAARIRPQHAAGKLSRAQCRKLAEEIKKILAKAILKGGTTLKDFMQSDGKPGYFRMELQVYGKGKEPCPRCGEKLKAARIGQRGTVYCGKCQL